MGTSIGTGPGELLLEVVVEVMTPLVIIVIGQKEDLWAVEEDLSEEEEEVIFPIEVMAMVMEMVMAMVTGMVRVMMMVKKVIKVVYLAIEDPQAHKDCKDH